MDFLKNKSILAVVGCIGVFRFIFFIFQTVMPTNFSGFERLQYFAMSLGDSFLGAIITSFLCVFLVAILALSGLVLPSVFLLIEAFGNKKIIATSKAMFLALLANSILLLMYCIIDGSVIGVAYFVFPLWGFVYGSFTGIDDVIFLFLTTVIQLFLLSSVITSRFGNDNRSVISQKSQQLDSGIPNTNIILGNGTRKMNQNASTWTVRIPGQPENPIDTATLQNWAKSGFLKADTMVTEIATGYSYQARQIPGVFSAKSFVTALLLSFFFGVFGVDRFYLGHIGVGLGKLFTFGGLGIWALIDFILIATKTVKDSQGIPLA